MKGSAGYSTKSGSPLGMYGTGIKYGGLPKLTGGYGLEKCLGGIKRYGPNQNGSGMVYAVIGIGYAGDSKEMAQGLQQYLPILGHYLTMLSSNYEKKFKRYQGLISAKGPYRSFGPKISEEKGNCGICGAPTFKGIDRCSICSSVMGGKY